MTIKTKSYKELFSHKTISKMVSEVVDRKEMEKQIFEKIKILLSIKEHFNKKLS